MRIAGVNTCSLVNGDGVRYVIFVQGCKHHCKGCQNQWSWDMDGGTDIPVEMIAEDVRKHRMVDGITLSGGDPFYQQDECVRLLKLLHEYNVWIYTGFEYEQIADTELAKMADVIVDGPFVEELRCEGKMYGSSNQRIIRLNKHDGGKI